MKSKKTTWNKLVSNIDQELKELRGKDRFSLVEISKHLEVSTSDKNPFFDTFFNYVDFHEVKALMSEENFQINQLQIEEKDFEMRHHVRTNTFLDFNLSLTASELSISTVQTREFSGGHTLDQLVQYYDNFLQQYITQGEEIAKSIQILPEEEVHTLLHAFNPTDVPMDFNATFLDVFQEQVEKNPDQIAVTFQSKQLSYQELDQRSNQLAHYLKTHYKAIANDLFIVMMDRSDLFLISMLGIWKSGAAYVPVDPALPMDRIKHMVEVTQTKAVLTESKYASQELKKLMQAKVVGLINGTTSYDKYSNESVDTNINPDDLSYIIFTSGSTGLPKGAMIQHKGMLNHLYSKLDVLDLDANSVIAQNASQSFDISVWQFVAALMVGGTTKVYSQELILNPIEFVNEVYDENVTILEVVPSYLTLLLEHKELGDLEENCFEHIDMLMVTGETLPLSLANQWHHHYPEIPLVNAYGPTEASDDITHHVIDQPQKGSVPIGVPIRNMRIYILDENDSLCPIGVKGELCVAGIGVGEGYLNDPVKTRKSFVTDIFREGVPMYRTGDIARFNRDGIVEFFGRNDDQVKIRGYRIELGEIENRLTQIDAIKQAAVLVKTDAQQNKFLVAYLVENTPLDRTEIETRLKEHLPGYMVPSTFVSMDTFPLTRNGKVDRKSLPKPKIEAHAEAQLVHPSTETEKNHGAALERCFGSATSWTFG